LRGYPVNIKMSPTRESSIHHPRYRRLVQVLAAHRISSGLSQEKLASLLGLSQPDISKIEACERRIDLLETLDWLNACLPNELSATVQNLLREYYASEH